MTKTRMEARIEIVVLVMQQLKEVQHGLQVLSTQMTNIPHPAKSSSARSGTVNPTDSLKGVDQELGVKEVDRG